MLLDLLMTKLTRTPGRHHRSFGHHHIGIRQSSRKMEALFHEQDGEPARVLESDDHVFDLIDNRGLNAFGWFVQQQHFGIGQECAPNRQLLLFTTAEDAARPIEYLRQFREQSIYFIKRRFLGCSVR